MIWAVCWTSSTGHPAEWHYGNEDVADQVASDLRRGWRKDARVEPR